MIVSSPCDITYTIGTGHTCISELAYSTLSRDPSPPDNVFAVWLLHRKEFGNVPRWPQRVKQSLSLRGDFCDGVDLSSRNPLPSYGVCIDALASGRNQPQQLHLGAPSLHIVGSRMPMYQNRRRALQALTQFGVLPLPDLFGTQARELRPALCRVLHASRGFGDGRSSMLTFITLC